MSFETNPSGRTRRWPRRRVLGSVLGLAVVVGTGVAAQASPHGDGFFTPPAAGHAAMAPTTTPTTPGGYAYHEPTARYQDGHDTMTGHLDYAHDRGWMWKGNGHDRWAFKTVGDDSDTSFNQLLGINNKGVVVGYYGSGKDDQHPNKGYKVAPMYGQNDFADRNYPGAMQTQEVGINDSQLQVGFYVEDDGSNHGFVRHGGTWEAVDYPGSKDLKTPFNQLLGISQKGMAAGFWNDDAGNAHGYLYDVRNDTYHPVKLPLHAKGLTATGVNDHGLICGFFTKGGNTHAFIAWRGGLRVLDLGDKKNTQALGINAAGTVVGSYEDKHGNTHGFVYEHRVVRTVDAPDADSTVVNGVNDHHQLVGYYEDGNGNTKGFLAHS
jgi:probable HAF family extracellular repeat protein